MLTADASVAWERFSERLARGVSASLVRQSPVVLTRAPGRLDVMGGIADYSGSLVCEATLDKACYAAIQVRSDGLLVMESLPWEDPEQTPAAEPTRGDSGEAAGLLRAVCPMSLLLDESRPAAKVEQVRAALTGTHAWARYVAGVVWALLDAKAIAPEQVAGGLTLVLSSEVPAGAGVSSSAALEVATARAVLSLLGAELDPLAEARACQRAENHVVGAPCGIMDQVASLLGQPQRMLKLHCQPHTLEGFCDLPPDCRVVGIDSRVKHSVGGTKYTEARVGAFMGHKLIVLMMRMAGALNTPADPTEGYLANVDPDDFVNLYRGEIPTRILGADYLKRWGQTYDSVTRIDPQHTYRPRSRTEHHIYEARRVADFAATIEQAGELDGPARSALLVNAGSMMYASHWSYGQRCGLGSVETEFIVNALREQGQASGIFGAKITGGGAGGTVAVLCDRTDASDAAIERVCDRYEERFSVRPRLFTGSSDGARASGSRRIEIPA